MKKLILASQSPYRKALLEKLKIPFSTVPSDIDEDSFKDAIEDPLQLCQTLAFEKAQVVQSLHKDCFVIGSDQISLFEGEVLGKPYTPEKAHEQLSRLQGKTHELITAVCLLGDDHHVGWTHKTKLTMRPLGPTEIERYVELDKPLDCAGSYKIEELGISLFENVETTDFTSIVGLPLMSLARELRKAGFPCP